MTNLARVRVEWSGTPVTGPGLSTFYFDSAGEGWVADLVTFFTAVRAFVPTGAAMTVPSSGDLIDDASGELVGAWSEPGGALVAGNGNGTWPQGVGARVVWATDGIRNGRRVKGSTFIVPIVSSSFEGASGLTAGAQSGLGNAANALVTAQAGTMRIWSRPLPGQAGTSSVVIDGDVPDKVSWLRTRRT